MIALKRADRKLSLILVLIAAVSTTLVLQAAELGAILALAAGIGVLVAAFILGNPYFGFYTLLGFSFFMFLPSRLVNVEFPIGFICEILTVLLLMSTLIWFKGGHRQAAGMFSSPVTVFLMIYLGYLLIEFFNPNMRSIQGAIFYYRKVFMFVIIYFVSYALFDSVEKVVQFVKVWLGLMLFAGLYACKQQWFGFFDFENRWLLSDPLLVGLYYQGGMFRKMSLLSDPSAFGIGCAATSVFSVVLAINARSKKVKWLLYTTGLVMVLGMLYSGTRTAYIVLGAGFALMGVMSIQSKRNLLFMAAAVVVFLGLAFGPFDSPAVNRFRTIFQASEDASLKVRDVNRAYIRPYMLSHPMGGGLATNGVEGEKFNPGHPLAGLPPDSGYLKIALETGWIGLLVLCGLYFVIMQQCIYHFYSHRQPVVKSIYLAFGCSFFSMMIGHYGQVAIGQFPGIIFFFAGMAIVARLHRLPSSNKSPQINKVYPT